MSGSRICAALVTAAFCACQAASAQSADPPGRVGLVSNVAGPESLLPVGETDWSTASLNMGSRPVRNANVPVQPADLATIRISARQVAAGAEIAPPPRGSPMDRARWKRQARNVTRG